MAREIAFLLNGAVETVSDVPPTTTLLQYLRRRKRLTGTKEGCAEGDCGACTVVLGDPVEDGTLCHRAANACILFLPMVHGRAVTTVEGLGGGASGEALHPGPARFRRASRLPVRLLHPGFRDVGLCGVAGRRTAGQAQRRRPDGRQPVPLHRLRADHRRNAFPELGGPAERGTRRRKGGHPVVAECRGRRLRWPTNMAASAGTGRPGRWTNWRRCTRRIPTPPSSPARPMSACG